MSAQHRQNILFPLFSLLFLIAACNQQPPPPTPTAACNPTPVSPPTLPDIVESISYQGAEVSGPVHSLHVEGDYIYMGLGSSFAILDVSNAAEPRLAGILPLATSNTRLSFENFSIHDNLAYFSWNNAAYTVDVSNPTEPVQVDCASDVPWPEAAAAFGERYFISNSYLGGIWIEERLPGRPEPVAVSSFTVRTLPEIEWHQSPGLIIPIPGLSETASMYVRNYAFDDRYLYMLNVIRTPGDYCCGRLTILDLQNPEEPKQAGAVEFPQELAPYYAKAVDDMLFVSIYEPRGRNPNILIYDVGNKRKPTELVSVPDASLPYFHAGYAYFPDDNKFDIWTLAGDDEPELVGRIDLPGFIGAADLRGEDRMAFVGDYLYLATADSFMIFNNEDQANPYLTAELPYPTPPNAERLDISNGRLAAVMYTVPDYEVQTLDVNEAWQADDWEPMPRRPIAVKFVDVAIAGDYAYGLRPAAVVGSRVTDLFVFDLSETAVSPTATLRLNDFESWRMTAAFPYLYLLQSAFETAPILKVLDISNPLNPVPVTDITLEEATYQDLTVWEDNLYIASTAGNAAIWRFDIGDGAQPQFVERLPFDLLHTIAVGDGYLFGLNLTNQIEIVDLRGDEAALVGRYDIERSTVEDIAYENGILYLALGNRGVAAATLNLDG